MWRPLLFTLFLNVSEIIGGSSINGITANPNQINIEETTHITEEIPTGQTFVDESTTTEGKHNVTAGIENEATFPTTEPVKLLIGQIDGISVLDVSIKKRLPRLVEEENVAFDSIDYIYDENLIFYTAVNSIKRATLGAALSLSDAKVIVNDTNGASVSLAVDWLHKRIYWIEVNSQTAIIADLDGTNRSSLTNDTTLNFTYPNNIVVDPYERLVFLVSNYAVYKTGLEGGVLERIYIDGNDAGRRERGVRTIAVDRVNKRLYISGEDLEGADNTHYLARVDYDGVHVGDYRMRDLHDIYSMDVIENTVYFAHYCANSTTDELLSISTDESDENPPSKLFRPRKNYHGISSVKIFHPCVQKPKCTIQIRQNISDQ